MSTFATRTPAPSRCAGLAFAFALATAALAQAPDPGLVDRAGELAYSRAVKAAAARGGPASPQTIANRVKQVASRLVAQTPALDLPRSAYGWAFTPLPGDAPRLDLYPGGRLVYNGMWLERMKLSDAELAALFAHALGHVVTGQVDARVIAEAGELNDPDPNRVVLRLADAIGKSHRTPWTPEQERAADRIGIELAARAGFDPRAAITFWHKVDTAADRQLIELHPVDAERVAALEAGMAEALKLQAEALAAANRPAPLPAQMRRSR